MSETGHSRPSWPRQYVHLCPLPSNSDRPDASQRADAMCPSADSCTAAKCIPIQSPHRSPRAPSAARRGRALFETFRECPQCLLCVHSRACRVCVSIRSRVRGPAPCRARPTGRRDCLAPLSCRAAPRLAASARATGHRPSYNGSPHAHLPCTTRPDRLSWAHAHHADHRLRHCCLRRRGAGARRSQPLPSDQGRRQAAQMLRPPRSILLERAGEAPPEPTGRRYGVGHHR
jgi:hypothetical protein